MFDKFHIAKHLGEAVDRYDVGNKDPEGGRRRPLNRTRYDWLRHPPVWNPRTVGILLNFATAD